MLEVGVLVTELGDGAAEPKCVYDGSAHMVMLILLWGVHAEDRLGCGKEDVHQLVGAVVE